MIDNIEEFENTVKKIDTTLESQWVPVWREAGQKFEKLGDDAEQAGDIKEARHQYLLAKTHYAIGRFPSEITDLKREISKDCSRAYEKACTSGPSYRDYRNRLQQFEKIRAHFRTPKAMRPYLAVLIMCGADVFKEDRGWAADLALENGMAALVMDAPGTGENEFPWAPESVVAWEAAIDFLMARKEVDASRVGAFGISRGGYSVLQLAGTAPTKVKSVVAVAGHPFTMSPQDKDMDEIVKPE